MRQSIFNTLPFALYRGDSTDKPSILATLNKAVEVTYQKVVSRTPSPKGEFEKTEVYEARVALEEKSQGAPQLKAQILTALMCFILARRRSKSTATTPTRKS